MTMISLMPTSNIALLESGRLKAPQGALDPGGQPCWVRSFLTSPSIVVPPIFCAGAPDSFAALDAFLEALHRAAQILADVAKLLGAEDQQHDHQDDQPVPDAHRAHAI